MLYRSILDDPQGFVGHQLADAQTFFPSACILPIAAQPIFWLLEDAVVGRDHPTLGAIHEDSHAAGLSLDFLAQRADQVGTEDADLVAQYLRVDGVVDQGRNCFALPADRLDDAHAPIVQVGSVIVVSNPAARLAGRDADRGRL